MQNHWDPELFQSLVRDAGLTLKETANHIGISPASVSQWVGKRSVPSIDMLVAIADLFGVSLDFLCGRCTKEESKEIQKDFKRYFKERNNEVYMRYLAIPVKKNIIPPGVEAPWPYNLLEDIFCKSWEEPLSASQEDGLEYVLTTLTERERNIVLLYYEQDLNLRQIGEQYQVTEERIRQILHKAVRKLRHPSRQRPVKLGYDKTGREKELQARAKALDEYEKHLQEKEAALNSVGKLLSMKAATTINEAKSLGVELEIDRVAALGDLPIEELDMSVRAFNVLYRAGIRTVSEIIMNADKLSSLRNMGRKTLEEIVEKIYEVCGVRLDTAPK